MIGKCKAGLKLEKDGTELIVRLEKRGERREGLLEILSSTGSGGGISRKKSQDGWRSSKRISRVGMISGGRGSADGISFSRRSVSVFLKRVIDHMCRRIGLRVGEGVSSEVCVTGAHPRSGVRGQLRGFLVDTVVSFEGSCETECLGIVRAKFHAHVQGFVFSFDACHAHVKRNVSGSRSYEKGRKMIPVPQFFKDMAFRVWGGSVVLRV